jgi:hypothetical protein
MTGTILTKREVRAKIEKNRDETDRLLSSDLPWT